MRQAFREAQARLRALGFGNQTTASAASPKANSSEQNLSQAFKAISLPALQDLINSLVLSECVYKLVSTSSDQAVDALNQFRLQFPAGLVSLQRVQASRVHVPHRYLLATSETTLFAAFVGTKFPRDLLVDATFLEELVWQEEPFADATKRQDFPSAHRGFLTRAGAVPVEWFFNEAQRLKKNLVLCGHSLGGAVAVLCTLRLLRQLPSGCIPPVRCVCFGSPAVGNAALARLVTDSGWEALFHSVALPGDIIPRLWALQVSPAEAEAVAQQLQAPEVDTDSPAPYVDMELGGMGDAPSHIDPSGPQPWWHLSTWRPGRFSSPAPQSAHAAPTTSQPDRTSEQGHGTEADTLVESPASLLAGTQQLPPTRLQQLQSLARTAGSRVTAAGTFVGAARRFWPGFVHLGKQQVWEADPGQPVPPLSALQALRSTLTLAAHRMPAYRAQALRICRLAGAFDGTWPHLHAHNGIQEGAIVTPVDPQQVKAQLGPLPPTPIPRLGEGSRWAWPRLPGPGPQQPALQPSTRIQVRAVGPGLQGVSTARVLVPGLPSGDFASPWVRLPLPRLSGDTIQQPRPQHGYMRRLRGAVSSLLGAPAVQGDGLRLDGSCIPENEELTFTTSIPEACARHVLEGAADQQLLLHCRSDLASARTPAVLSCPEAWLVEYRLSPTDWGRSLRSLLSSTQQWLPRANQHRTAPVSSCQRLTIGVDVVRLAEGEQPVVLPHGTPLVVQRLSAIATAAHMNAHGDQSHTPEWQLPQVLIIEHHCALSALRQGQAKLAEVCSAASAAKVPILIVVLVPSHVSGLSSREFAATYQLPEQHIVITDDPNYLNRMSSDAKHGKGGMTSIELQRTLYWLVTDGQAPEKAISKL